MTRPTLLIITGPPASGKTTVGRALARELRMPFYSKDDVKEILFDTIGIGDAESGRRLGSASWELLFMIAATELAERHSLVLEANFYTTDHSERIRVLSETHVASTVQLRLAASERTLLDRYIARSNERHPSHFDERKVDDVAASLKLGAWEPLDLEGPLIQVDTTDFSRVDLESIARNLAGLISEAPD